jgi:hypothetical protein
LSTINDDASIVVMMAASRYSIVKCSCFLLFYASSMTLTAHNREPVSWVALLDRGRQFACATRLAANGLASR